MGLTILHIPYSSINPLSLPKKSTLSKMILLDEELNTWLVVGYNEDYVAIIHFGHTNQLREGTKFRVHASIHVKGDPVY